MPLQVRKDISDKSLECLGDDSLLIRNAASRVISSLIKLVGLSDSLELLYKLLDVMENQGNSVYSIGAGNCLNIILEDYKVSFSDPSLKRFILFK